VKRSKEGGRKKNNDEGKDKQVLCTWYSEFVQEMRPIPPLYKFRTGVVSGAKFPGKHAHTAHVHGTCPGSFII